jgi:hypothetical protein
VGRAEEFVVEGYHFQHRLEPWPIAEVVPAVAVAVEGLDRQNDLNIDWYLWQHWMVVNLAKLGVEKCPQERVVLEMSEKVVATENRNLRLGWFVDWSEIGMEDSFPRYWRNRIDDMPDNARVVD